MIVSRNRDNGTFTIKISLEELRNYGEVVQDRLCRLDLRHLFLKFNMKKIVDNVSRVFKKITLK